MSMFKCKMCGGDLEVTQEMSVCECQYCGSKQTLPRLSDEKKNNLYDRAGHFRRNNEYDKAMAIYEQILNEDTEDAESYWSIVLCKYGIEYVEDPMTHRRVPTVNRAQMTSIFMDENYKSALKYADSEQRAVYEAEAKEIEQIQKGILEISAKEEPFDVFICYKESDTNGRRTPDSVLANDLYHQLTQEGFKVFFARITLEDKLGSAYEPYIFAALNSAKVMVVLGTKPEYFTAVWVKNEWSRFLAQIKGGANKVLIPAYKDMDPYDLPEEFSHLQAQDMSKLGFMQDLIRGIKKITGAEEKKAATQARTVESVPTSNGAQALVERAFLFLEDGDFTRADELCEQALNQDPKNPQAYVGKLMVERQIRKQEDLSEGMEELTENNYFQKALRFAEEGLKKELERCNQMIMDRNKDFTYEEALQMVKDNGVQGGIQAAIKVLESAIGKYESLLGWRDSEAQIDACKSQKEALVAQLYQNTLELVDKHNSKKIDSKTMVNAMGTAIANLEFLDDYLDSKKLLSDCIAKKKTHEKKLRRERSKKIVQLISLASFIAAIIFIAVSIPKVVQNVRYNSAVACMEKGKYERAVKLFEKVEGYKDSEAYIDKCTYENAIDLMAKGEYAEAKALFEELGNYGLSKDYIKKCIEGIETEEYKLSQYEKAIEYKKNGSYEEAIAIFDTIREYKDVEKQIEYCMTEAYEPSYKEAMNAKKNKEYEEAIRVLKLIPSDYKDVGEQINDCYYQWAMSCKKDKEYDKAIEVLKNIPDDYEDVLAQIKECNNSKWEEVYQKALTYKDSKEYDKAISSLKTIPNDYKDVKELLEECSNLKKEVIYQKALKYKQEKNYTEAISIFESIGNYSDAKEQIKECQNLWSEEIYQKALAYKEKEEYETAISTFSAIDMDSDGSIDNYKDVSVQIDDCYYQIALIYKQNKQYNEAIITFKQLADYKDSQAQVKECNNLIIYDNALTYKNSGDYVSAICKFEEIIGFKDSSDLITECKNYITYNKAIECKNNYLFSSAIAIFETIEDFKDAKLQIEECNTQLQLISYKQNQQAETTSIAAGYDCIYAIKTDGTVLAASTRDEAPNVSDWRDITAISSNNLSEVVGLKSDGTLVAEGWNKNASTSIADWTNIVAIDTSLYHIVGITVDGNVKIATIDDSDTGINYTSYDVINWSYLDESYHWSDIVDVECTYRNLIGIKSNGTVVITGMWTGTDRDYANGRTSNFFNSVSMWENIVNAELGTDRVIGLTDDGQILLSRNFEYMYANKEIDSFSDNEIVQVELLDDYRVLGLKKDGTIVHNPFSNSEEFDDWGGIIKLVTIEVDFYSDKIVVGIRYDGTVALYSEKNAEFYKAVENWTDIVDVVVCDSMIVGLKADGTIVTTDEELNNIVQSWTDIKVPVLY